MEVLIECSEKWCSILYFVVLTVEGVPMSARIRDGVSRIALSLFRSLDAVLPEWKHSRRAIIHHALLHCIRTCNTTGAGRSQQFSIAHCSTTITALRWDSTVALCTAPFTLEVSSATLRVVHSSQHTQQETTRSSQQGSFIAIMYYVLSRSTCRKWGSVWRWCWITAVCWRVGVCSISFSDCCPLCIWVTCRSMLLALHCLYSSINYAERCLNITFGS